MRFSRNPANPFDVLSYFYSPSWSLLYWISVTLRPDARALESAMRAKGMALLLHALDNHLVDGQQTPTHLLLQLRTAAWTRFAAAARRVAPADSADGVEQRIDRYFRAIGAEPGDQTLEQYLEQTDSEGLTWIIAPESLARCVTEESRVADSVAASLTGFIRAFRLLDDIHDLVPDAVAGKNTAVRSALPTEERILWDACRGVSASRAQPRQDLDRCLQARRILPHLAGRVRTELEHAADHAREAGLDGYAEMLAEHARPIAELLAVDSSAPSFAHEEQKV